MSQPISRQIIPGIMLDPAGHASVDGPTGKRLIELAIALESHTRHPVDVQHVLAGIIVAASRGELAADEALPPTSTGLCGLLARHVDALFARHGGRVAADE